MTAYRKLCGLASPIPFHMPTPLFHPGTISKVEMTRLTRYIYFLSLLQILDLLDLFDLPQKIVCSSILYNANVISYHFISYHIILYYIISYHIISYHIISYIIFRKIESKQRYDFAKPKISGEHRKDLGDAIRDSAGVSIRPVVVVVSIFRIIKCCFNSK